jgi:hypothetical protein
MAGSWFKWLIAGIFSLSAGKQGEPAHPFYVSVTEMSHNAKEQILEISCKMFTNDLETALEKTGGGKADLADPKDKNATDKRIAEYITRHLQLKINGGPVVMQWVGSEQESESTWCYLQVGHVASVHQIDLANSLLYDSFDKEINIMHATVGGKRQSNKLSYPDTKISFEF